ARLFKRSTGVPPHRFLIRRRIDEARALLAARTVPIGAIARLVGFRTPSHFTTTFRRITGMTPSAYRSGAGAGVGSPPVAVAADAFDVIRELAAQIKRRMWMVKSRASRLIMSYGVLWL